MGVDWYPKAVRREQSTDGGSMVGGSPRGVWHTTETTSIASGDPYYHISFKDDPAGVIITQYRPFGRASRALFNGPDPVQTNRQGTVNINAVIIGYAKDSPSLSDRMIEAMAEFMVWAEGEWGIPAVLPLTFQGSSAWGVHGEGRMSISAWVTFTGWAGHQDVPDGNTHWDPGKIPVEKIYEAMELYMATFKDVPEDHLFYNDIETLAELGITKGYGDGTFRPDNPVTRAQMAAFIVRTIRVFEQLGIPVDDLVADGQL